MFVHKYVQINGAEQKIPHCSALLNNFGSQVNKKKGRDYMKKLSFTNRLFALLLALVLVVGLGPAANLTEVSAANEEPVVVIAGSDFQSYKEVGGSKVDDFDAGAKQIKNFLNVIKKDGHSKADGFLFVGDYNYPYVPGDAQAASASTSAWANVRIMMPSRYRESTRAVSCTGSPRPICRSLEERNSALPPN